MEAYRAKPTAAVRGFLWWLTVALLLLIPWLNISLPLPLTFGPSPSFLSLFFFSFFLLVFHFHFFSFLFLSFGRCFNFSIISDSMNNMTYFVTFTCTFGGRFVLVICIGKKTEFIQVSLLVFVLRYSIIN